MQSFSVSYLQLSSPVTKTETKTETDKNFEFHLTVSVLIIMDNYQMCCLFVNVANSEYQICRVCYRLI